MKQRPKTIVNSWKLLKSSVSFLKSNKDLIILPVISFMASMLILILGGGLLDTMIENAGQVHWLMTLILLALAYFILAFLSIFFNATLILCSAMRLQGQSMTISEALVKTSRRFPQLLGWSLISSVVGLIINSLENTHNVFATIVAVILSFSWSFCAFFVLPIVVLEGIGPIAALKKSAQKFGIHWRRVASVNLIFLLFVMGLLAIVYVISTFFLEISSPLVVVFIIGLACFVILVPFIATLGAVVKSAIYLHTIQKIDMPYFEAQLLDKVIVPRKKMRQR